MSKKESFNKAVERQFDRLKIQHLAQQKFEAWQAEQANPKPKSQTLPAHIARNPAALAAYGIHGEPVLPIKDFDSWQKRVQDRQDKLDSLNSTSAGIFDWANDFLAAEERNKDIATQLLMRAYSPEAVAATVGWPTEEVVAFRKELGI